MRLIGSASDFPPYGLVPAPSDSLYYGMCLFCCCTLPSCLLRKACPKSPFSRMYAPSLVTTTFHFQIRSLYRSTQTSGPQILSAPLVGNRDSPHRSPATADSPWARIIIDRLTPPSGSSVAPHRSSEAGSEQGRNSGLLSDKRTSLFRPLRLLPPFAPEH